MFDSRRDDLANMISEAVAEINAATDSFAKGRRVLEFTAFFESPQIPVTEAQFFLDTLKDGAKNGEEESLAMLQGIAEEIAKVSALEDCANAAQYRGKLTKAFAAAKQVMSENGAGAKTHLVDSFYHRNIEVLLSIAERVSALQGNDYTDPQALYEAIKDVTVGDVKAKKPGGPQFRL